MKKSHFYYNATVNNNTNGFQIAEFRENRTQAILDNPSEYSISVVRFSIPGAAIPLFFWPGDNVYSVTARNNGAGISHTTFLQYATAHWDDHTLYAGRQPIWSINQFLVILNQALTTAYTAVGTGINNQIFFHYEPSTKLFRARAPVAQYPPYGINLRLWFNGKLSDLFNTLPSLRSGAYNDATFFEVMVVPYQLEPPPSTGYTIIETEASPLWSWFQVSTLMITTDIPVRNEAVLGVEGRAVGYPILTDFQPSVTGDIRENQLFQYIPQAEFRRIDLLSEMPLTHFGCRVWWQDINGTPYPLYVPPFSQLSIKFMFESK